MSNIYQVPVISLSLSGPVLSGQMLGDCHAQPTTESAARRVSRLPRALRRGVRGRQRRAHPGQHERGRDLRARLVPLLRGQC